MDRELAKEMGAASGESIPTLKLNEVNLHGDKGIFVKRGILEDKTDDDKTPKHELGGTLDGVIYLMRWRLTKYEKDGAGGGKYTNSTEYDNKNSGSVTVFLPDKSRDSGTPVEMKTKYQLKTERVLYTYLPEYKESVRLIAKASALTGDLNPNGGMGLFEYQAYLEECGQLPINVITTFGAAFRNQSANEREHYYAMTFSKKRDLEEAEQQKMIALMRETRAKVMPVSNDYGDGDAAPEATDYPQRT